MVERVNWFNSDLESLLGETYKKGSKVKAYNRKTNDFEEIKLNYFKSLKLALRGFIAVGERRYADWTEAVDFYVYTCKVNDKKVFMLDYPHGYYGRLDCRL
jgi:hypothetical protein